MELFPAPQATPIDPPHHLGRWPADKDASAPCGHPRGAPIGESYTARDSQLDAEVKELLNEVDARKKR
jgi:hypothetical protein